MASAMSPVLVGFLFIGAVQRSPKAVMATFLTGSAVAIASQLAIPNTRALGSGALIWKIDPILVSLPAAIITLAIGTWLETGRSNRGSS